MGAWAAQADRRVQLLPLHDQGHVAGLPASDQEDGLSRRGSGQPGSTGARGCDAIPQAALRLNEGFTQSHHPLWEAIIDQTGPTSVARRPFLQRMHSEATQIVTQQWAPEDVEQPAF